MNAHHFSSFQRFVLFSLLLSCIVILVFSIQGCNRHDREEKLFKKELGIFVDYLQSCDSVYHYRITAGVTLKSDSFYLERYQPVPDHYYVGFYHIPDVQDTCYWAPQKCSTPPRVTFIKEFDMLVKNGIDIRGTPSCNVITLDSNTILTAYERICPYIPLPCLDITEEDLKDHTYKIVCFHQFKYCYWNVDSEPALYVEK